MKIRAVSSLIATIAMSLLAGPTALHAMDADITKTKIVEASADTVWGLLRQMDDIDRYSSAVAEVNWMGNHGVGGERVCIAPDGQGQFREKIVAFNDDARSYAYHVLEGVPVAGMTNQFKVVDLGYNRAMIVWTCNYDTFMENPNMNEEQFLAFLHQTIDEFILNVTKTSIHS